MSHEHPYSIKRHGTTLEKCEHEPVHTPGCIQSCGALLVLRLSDLVILQASENSQEWFGLPPQELLAKNVSVAVGARTVLHIRQALNDPGVERKPLYLRTIEAGEMKNNRPLDVSLHTCAGLALLEIEAALKSDFEPLNQTQAPPDYYGLVRQTLARFQDTLGIQALSRVITEELRRITELDRVMVYRFDADDCGEVIAESKRDDQVSWLGWRYPAHDIPRPAREIFKKIWSRPVPDIRAELFEMVPLLNPDTRAPLDMTYCYLRGASVMYTEYLDNMGVRAAFTLPLKRGNELWGMIACHHDTPKILSYRVRAASEFLAQGASQQLMWTEGKENNEYRISLEEANYALMSKVALDSELSAFTEGAVHLGSDLVCGGAAIFFQETWNTVGQTPRITEMTVLGQWLAAQPACQSGSIKPIFESDHLSELYPAAIAFAENASGMMAFCFSRNPLGLVFYFRPETLQTLTWAGNPNELPIIQGPHGPRLSPRKSFEIWRETVRSRSMPWEGIEVESVLKLRGLMIDMLVSRAEELNILRLRVTERTQEVVASKERLLALAAIVEYSQDAIIGEDLDSIIISWNHGAENIFGYSSTEMVGESITRIIPDRRRDEEAQILEHIRCGTPVKNFETQRKTKDGRLIDVSVSASPIKTSSGDIIGVSKVAREITEQKQADARFRRLVESNAQGVMFYNRTGEISGANDAFLRLVGYSRDDLESGQINWMAMTPVKYADFERPFIEILDATGVCGPYEKEFIRKDGTLVPILIGAAAFEDNPKQGVCFVIDLTERKSLEQQFLRAQRMEGIGTLAGGIAHDLNNILAPILLIMPMLREGSSKVEKEELITIVEKATQRGANIIKQLLTFSRGTKVERGHVQVRHLIKEMAAMMRETFPREIEIVDMTAAGLWPISADATQIHQVLMNLCVNARDAMRTGGKLTLSAKNMVVSVNEAAGIPGAKAGSYLCLTISDTGEGISRANLDRIFEPFFTTKEIGKGTGLGLSTVLGIVKGHGGFVSVYSEEGRGTSFTVQLPAIDDSISSRADSTSPIIRGKGETILVVDDEPVIQRALGLVLRENNYIVLDAANATEALTLFLANRDKVSLLLTDIMMPGMNGVALIRMLRKINPGLPAIAASGLHDDDRREELAAIGVHNILEKPFSPSEILSAVEQELASSATVTVKA